VSTVGQQSLFAKQSPWVGLPGTTQDTTRLRELYASLIESDVEGVSMMPSTGFAMTMAARNVLRMGRLRKDELVLVLEREMASVIYPWQTVCEEAQASLLVVRYDDDVLRHSWTSQILQAIDVSETKQQDIAAISIPHVHWCDGTYIDFDAINQRLDQYASQHRYRDNTIRRPLLIVDGTQSIGALPFSVKSIHPDFVACSVHKWLLSPYGMSLVYIGPEHRANWIPLDLHERGRLNSDDPSWDEIVHFRNASGYPKTFFNDGRKFDSGGRANPILVPMVTRALEIVHEISPRQVQIHSLFLAKLLTRELSILSTFFHVIPESQRASHIVGIKPTHHAVSLGIDLSRIADRLKDNDVFVSIRGETIRVALYIYNSASNVYKLASLLTQIVQEAKQKLNIPRRSILITGANGWLAQFVFQSILKSRDLNDHFSLQVYSSYSNPEVVPHWILKENRLLMDFSSTNAEDAVVRRESLQRIKPDVIIHLAAISSPLRCHKDPTLAMMVNCPDVFLEDIEAILPDTLVLYSSTDMVYDGERSPYFVVDMEGSLSEDPINVYGTSKRLFEKKVLKLQNSFSLRLSNMIGKKYVYQSAGEKFLQFLWGCYKDRKCIGLKYDEVRSFVHAEDVISVMKKLILSFWFQENGEYHKIRHSARILNVGGPKGVSRLELAQILATKLNTPFYVGEDHNIESETNLEDRTCSTQDAWKVVLLSNSGDHAGSSNALRNPRNISMNVEDTERILSMSFSKIDDIILDCLDL
jgi:selenocysteine lyase/cysteine desulfurase/dTDP-4-dehydrorhamnose reductase